MGFAKAVVPGKHKMTKAEKVARKLVLDGE